MNLLSGAAVSEEREMFAPNKSTEEVTAKKKDKAYV